MTPKIVGLFRDQQSLELAGYYAGSRNPIARYRKTIWYKARPRSREYMRELFLQRYPEGNLICLDETPGWLSFVSDAHLIVLLYADAIGLGFFDVERSLDGRTRPRAAVRVLNGRQREFILNRGTLWALRMRRLIERMMLGELAFFLFFSCVTPYLLASDLLRGRNDEE